MDANSTALVIVDMQNDFLHKDGFVPRHGKEIGMPDSTFDLLRGPIPAIRRLADFFHDRQLHVVYIYTAWEPDHSDVAIPLKHLKNRAREEGCLVRGSWGAEIIDELSPRAGSHMVMKKAYGGFFQTVLDRMLRNLGVKTLCMAGVATNFCVETTAREAVGYGYDVILVRDATATHDREGYEATMKVMAMGFGEVLTAAEVMEQLSGKHV